MVRSFSSSQAVSAGRIAALAAMLSFVPAALAVPISTLEVSSTLQGANTTIDRGTSKIWNFSVGDGFTIEDVVGSLVLKEGRGTTEPIMFSLFGGSDAVGPVLATTSVAAGTVGQSFDNEDAVHFFLNDVNINAGNYSLKLYSWAADGGKYQWFFKGAGKELTGNIAAIQLTGNTAAIRAFEIGADSISIPEPGTLALFGLGLGLAGVGFSRRKLH